MGVWADPPPAHKLAQTRTGAGGVLLYHHGDVPIDVCGDTWPAGVDFQIHISGREASVRRGG